MPEAFVRRIELGEQGGLEETMSGDFSAKVCETLILQLRPRPGWKSMISAQDRSRLPPWSLRRMTKFRDAL